MLLIEPLFMLIKHYLTVDVRISIYPLSVSAVRF